MTEQEQILTTETEQEQVLTTETEQELQPSKIKKWIYLGIFVVLIGILIFAIVNGGGNDFHWDGNYFHSDPNVPHGGPVASPLLKN